MVSLISMRTGKNWFLSLKFILVSIKNITTKLCQKQKTFYFIWHQPKFFWKIRFDKNWRKMKEQLLRYWKLTTPWSSQLPGAHNYRELTTTWSSQLPGAHNYQELTTPRSSELTTPGSSYLLGVCGYWELLKPGARDKICSQELWVAQEASPPGSCIAPGSSRKIQRELPGGWELPGAFFGFVDRPDINVEFCSVEVSVDKIQIWVQMI